MCLAHEYVFQSTKGKMFTSKKKDTLKDSSRPQSARRSAILKSAEESVSSAQSDKSESDYGNTKFVSLQYDIAMGRLYMLNGDYPSAVHHLRRAAKKDILVSSMNVQYDWYIVHVRILIHTCACISGNSVLLIFLIEFKCYSPTWPLLVSMPRLC